MQQLPADFISNMRQQIGECEAERLFESLDGPSPVSIRINGAKWHGGNWGTPIAWSKDGRYLDTRPQFTTDIPFAAGAYYVQEAGSQFISHILKTEGIESGKILDMCAAPGGKSTLYASVVGDRGLVVANEYVRNRANILADNIRKWGLGNVVVTNNDPSHIAAFENWFDVVAVDAPCSGEGMFRKDQVAVDEWSLENVDICWQRQRRILTDIWPALKPGGLLIYSTCTFNREEDEDNVAWIARELGADVLEVPVEDAWGITGNLVGKDFPVYRFLPHRTRGEGFFLAVLRKHAGEVETVEPRAEKKKKGKDVKGKAPQLSVPKEAKTWLAGADSFGYALKDTQVVAFPKAHETVYTLLQQHVKVIHAGVTLGEIKGKDLIPHHSLAMSTALGADVFPRAEIGYEQAIAFLRKEGLVLDASVPRGYVLLTYQQIPLGFVKNIGNRANNLYPQEWRIRSGYLPEEVVCVY